MPQSIDSYAKGDGTLVRKHTRDGPARASASADATRRRTARAAAMAADEQHVAGLHQSPSLGSRDETADVAFAAVSGAAKTALSTPDATLREAGYAAGGVPGAPALTVDKIVDAVGEARGELGGVGELSPDEASEVRSGVEGFIPADTEDALRRVDSAYDRIDTEMSQVTGSPYVDEFISETEAAVEAAAGSVLTRAASRQFVADATADWPL